MAAIFQSIKLQLRHILYQYLICLPQPWNEKDSEENTDVAN